MKNPQRESEKLRVVHTKKIAPRGGLTIFDAQPNMAKRRVGRQKKHGVACSRAMERKIITQAIVEEETYGSNASETPTESENGASMENLRSRVI